MITVKQDKFILGQSSSKTIASSGEEIRLDLQLQPMMPTVGATVEGKVTDTNGAAITNALIKIMDSNFEPLLHAVTNLDGNYLFNNIPASNSYTIFAIAPGKKIKQGQGFSLSDGASKKVDFTLENDPSMQLAIIAGDLYQSGTTNPINGAVVTLFEVDENGVETLSAITNTNEFGQFVFREVSNGNYNINISALGFISDSVTASVTSAPQIVSINPTLQPDPNSQNGTVSGVILDNFNAPIDRADVILYKVNGDDSLTPVAFTKTNTTGVYLFINVPQGTYKVKSNELEIVEIDIDPPLGQAPNLDKLTLSEAVTISPIILQAQNGILENGATINQTVSPGFVDFIGGNTNGSVTLNVNVPLSGEYTMSIEHINTNIRNLVIEVNGVPTGTVYEFPATPSFAPSDAMIFSTNINLLQGTNTIKLLGDGSSSFAPVINNITFNKIPFTGNKTATDFNLANGAILNNTPTDPNFGFVSSIGSNGGGINGGSASITVNAPIAGIYDFDIVHINSDQRTWSISVNGTFVGDFITPPSSSPSTFSLSLVLQQGNNTIMIYAPEGISGADIKEFTFNQKQFFSLTEAENAILGGSASINDQFVLNIGGSGNGYVQIVKDVPFTGEYDLTLSYVASDANKTARVLINNVDTGNVYTFEQTNSLNIADVKTKSIRLNLNAGSNTIKVI